MSIFVAQKQAAASLGLLRFLVEEEKCSWEHNTHFILLSNESLTRRKIQTSAVSLCTLAQDEC